MWIWVVQFMQAKGGYLLHGAMVNPQDLANARRKAAAECCIFGFVAIVESGQKELRRRPGDQAARL